MDEEKNKYAGSVPDVYLKYIEPILFEPYAIDLAARVVAPEQSMVLEIACGTGVLAKYLLDQLDESVKLIATDLNPAMLDAAESRFEESINIQFQTANGIDLPFSDNIFDSVACQFGVMLFPDILLGYREAARVLKPGGQFVFNVWDVLEENYFSKSVHEIALTLDENNPPDFLKVPYAYTDVSLITLQLEKAGFSNIEIMQVDKESRANSARDLALGLAAGSPLAKQLVDRGIKDESIEIIEKALIDEYGKGEITAQMRALVIDAKMPI